MAYFKHFLFSFVLLEFLTNTTAEESSSHIWAVRLNHSDHVSVAQNLGLTSHGQVFHDVHEFRLYKKDHAILTEVLGSSEHVVKHVHSRVMSHPSVVWAEFQQPLNREKRTRRFNDPSFSQQWHLVNDREEGHDINVTGVWMLNITGQGVTVAIVDDGLEHDNVEIQGNYNSYGSYDFNGEDHNPMPDVSTIYNSHGTRCAGLVAAVANNSVCGIGVAYNSSVTGIRLLDGTITDLLEAKSLTYKTHINDIYSCSWGPTDDGMTVEAPGTLAQLALQLGTERGRYGYGSIFVFASGNGGSKDDNCNFDGYANSIYTVTIGAVDELDKKPYYAEECAAKFAVTYSNGVRRGDRNIVTADIKRSHSCTASFSGTSAAAPMAAGVIALALEVRPCLTWHDIQNLLVYTAVPIDLQDVDWTTNGAGLRHSHQHGFGVLDAYRLTMAARVWPLLPESSTWSSRIQHVDLELPYSDTWMESNITVYDNDLPSTLSTLQHVAISVTLEHSYRGAIVIDLVSPSGTVSHLATTRSRDSSSQGLSDWMFTTVRCWGEKPDGMWSVRILDDKNTGPSSGGKSRGKLVQWRLILHGVNITSNDIEDRKLLIEEIVSNTSYERPIQCPPHPTNVMEITFPDVATSNKFFQIITGVAAVIIILLLLQILITYVLRRCKERQKYLPSLPPVLFHRQSSTAEEEVLLLDDVGNNRSQGNNEGWKEEETEVNDLTHSSRLDDNETDL